MSPMSAWLLLQGLETLHVRMDRHNANAVAVAKFLQGHAQVSWVNYPGLPGSPYYELAQKYLPKGVGAIMTFGIKGGQSAGVRFIEAAQFMSHLANVGDAKTLVIHPASTTHRQLSEEEQIKAGVTPDMIRLSIDDDGRGFSSDEAALAGNGHFGLVDMKERAQSMGCCLQMESIIGGGTHIEVQVPSQQLRHEEPKIHTYSGS